ncbi:MAG: histidinol-phosphatase [Lachnospiraceae bacterium]|nr:histidinol-phosphatase [Lachnospiraceae bacterium]
MSSMKQNLHTHTVYCDGKSTPEEIVLTAIDRGLDSIGFSGHAYTSCDEGYCMMRDDIGKYRRDVLALKEKYADRIRIYCGIEQDYYADPLSYSWDYVIGSVHYLLADGVFIPVDENRETLERAAAEHFNGDIYSLIELYYKTVARVVQVTGCDIIGHFDIIRKFNDDGTLFDASHPDYMIVWSRALDMIFTGADTGLFKTGFQRSGACADGAPIFEINTGAISRGYCALPYPSIDILRSVNARGGRIMITSDSHEADTIDAYYDLARDIALDAGFTEQTVLTEDGFVSVPL